MSPMTKFLILVLSVLNCGLIDCKHKNGLGFTSFNPFGNARHGDRKNEENGGTCVEFLQLNGLDQCCAERQDDCYMIHFDTRCYCDVFCDRKESDCCPDAIRTCKGGPITTTPAITTTPDLYEGFKK